MPDDNDKKPFTILQGKNSPSLSKDALRKMRVEMDGLKEYLLIEAELMKIKFDALKSHGFTDQQALELCKRIFGGG